MSDEPSGDQPTRGDRSGSTASDAVSESIVDVWLRVVRSPGRFFDREVAPGDQQRGLFFAIAVGTVYVAGTLVVTPERLLGPDRIPVVGGSRLLAGTLLVLLTAVFAVPLLLHLVAALQTVLLAIGVDERAGVSETVQVVAYATAPGAIAWLPFAPAQLLVALYGAALLAVGLSRVHGISIARAALLAAVPAIVVFGWLFGGFAAASETVALVG